MFSWPDPGTRVTVRYRRPPGSVPPLTDAVGRLLTVDPTVRVQTKTGAVVEFAPADVVALRVLTDTPIRTSQIRALEHAAAAAWPAAEQTWLHGWLLRAGPPSGRPAGPAADSAVPLDLSAHADAIPEIAGWYQRRGLTPRLAVPDRMLTPPPGLACERTERVVVQDLSRPSGDEPGVRVDASVAQAALSAAPDGARWVGLWVPPGGHDAEARAGCEALLAWGAGRGATRAYLAVPDDEAAALELAGALGFRLHHRRRYLTVPAGPVG